MLTRAVTACSDAQDSTRWAGIPSLPGGSHTVWIRPHRARCSPRGRPLISYGFEMPSLAGQLRKVYRFVTAKNVSWDEHTVETPIAHHKKKRAVMIVKRGANTPCRGKWHPAHTVFRRIGEVDNGATLWEAVIKTGVMHQIRAHAAFVGIPLRGTSATEAGVLSERPMPSGFLFCSTTWVSADPDCRHQQRHFPTSGHR